MTPTVWLLIAITFHGTPPGNVSVIGAFSAPAACNMNRDLEYMGVNRAAPGALALVCVPGIQGNPR